MAYYFLIASLPTLQFNSNPPLSCEEFLSRCRLQLNKNDFDVVEGLIKNGKGNDDNNDIVLKKWINFNHNFKNEMAFFRAKRAGKDPSDYLRGPRNGEDFFKNVIEEAAKAQNPLSTEKIFDQSRWQFLDDLQRFEYFNLAYLICYALKLSILERYENINSPKGRAIFGEYRNIDVTLN